MTVIRLTPPAMKHILLAASHDRCPWQLVLQLQWCTQHFAHLHVMGAANNILPTFLLIIGLFRGFYQTELWI